MKRLFCYAVLFAFTSVPACAQTNAPTPHQLFPPTPPADIVDQLWTMATTGELLTTEGIRKASSLYASPGPLQKSGAFDVVSNFWGQAWVDKDRTTSTTAEVILEYLGPAGSVDSKLRYTPPPPSRAIKFGMIYRLTLAPTHTTQQILKRSGSVKQKNGYVAPTWKVVGTKTIEGDPAWRIDGPQQKPFATINTAIRYVLEMRSITKDPVIKQNADKTLRILLRADDLYRKYPPSACACD